MTSSEAVASTTIMRSSELDSMCAMTTSLIFAWMTLRRATRRGAAELCPVGPGTASPRLCGVVSALLFWACLWELIGQFELFHHLRGLGYQLQWRL